MSDNVHAEPSYPLLRRPGIGHKKTRTGCATCKIRRVKCDEAKPACRRCADTGRKCDGYPALQKRRWFGSSRSETPPDGLLRIEPMPVSRQLYSLPSGLHQKRSLEFYHYSMAPKISGHFDSLFWNRLILQLSHSEPCVIHAIAALSCMYEQFETSSHSNPPYSAKGYDVALESYNAAMKSLSAKLDNDVHSVCVPLVACILFVCLEFLRRDIDAAMAHIHSGCAILRMRAKSLSRDSPRTKSSQLPDFSGAEVIEEVVVAMFARLRILCGLFFRPAPLLQTDKTELEDEDQSMPASFSNLNGARDALNVKMGPALSFVRITIEAKYNLATAATHYRKQNSIIAGLNFWRRAFEDWLLKRKELTRDEKVAADLLRLQHGAVYIWLSTCLNVNETAFDDYTANFNELVNLAASVIDTTTKSKEHSSPFSFEMGTIPPLCLVGFKCRHPVIRRRAIDLLLSSPRREGLWDAYRIGRVAERVLIHEEHGLYLHARRGGTHGRSFVTRELPQLTLQGEIKTNSACLNLFAEDQDRPAAYIPASRYPITAAREHHAHDLSNADGLEQRAELKSKLTTALTSGTINNLTSIASGGAPSDEPQQELSLPSELRLNYVRQGYGYQSHSSSGRQAKSSIDRSPLISGSVRDTLHFNSARVSFDGSANGTIWPSEMSRNTTTSRIQHSLPQDRPEEVSRIHEVRIAHEALPAGEAVLPLTFKWKPNGLKGDWHVWGEVLQL